MIGVPSPVSLVIAVKQLAVIFGPLWIDAKIAVHRTDKIKVDFCIGQLDPEVVSVAVVVLVGLCDRIAKRQDANGDAGGM